MSPKTSASQGTAKYAFKRYFVTLPASPPVQNQWYTLLDQGNGVRVYNIHLIQNNDEAAAKDIEARITIDGETSSGSQSCPAASYHAVDLRTNSVTIQNTTLWEAGFYIFLEGHAIKVELRMTSVPGTNQLLFCKCDYGIKEAV